MARSVPSSVAHPGHDRAVVEAEHELHPHLDTSTDSLDDPHEVGLRLARRHEVDEPDGAVVGLELGLEDERVAPVRRRVERNSPAGWIVQWPFSASPSSAAKSAPESKRGRHSQSTEPSRLTSAADCRSPMSP